MTVERQEHLKQHLSAVIVGLLALWPQSADAHWKYRGSTWSLVHPLAVRALATGRFH